MNITRIGLALGAQVTGVDLREQLGDDAREQIRAALYEHQVLIFRDQQLEAEQHLAAASIFGIPVPPEPAAFLGTTDPIQVFVRDARRAQTADRWHTDTSFMAEPPIAGVLMPLRLPRLGGDTVWASLYSIYDALSEPMRELCKGLHGEHSMRVIRDFFVARNSLTQQRLAEMDEAFPPRLHPLVQEHWVTGRKLIYDGGEWMERIAGLNPAENTLLREFLRNQIEKVQFQFRWRWAPTDLAVWDERSTNHIGLSDHYEVDPNRVMRSIFVRRAEYSAPAHRSRPQ